MAIVANRNKKKTTQKIDVSIGKIKMGKTKKTDEQWKNQMRTNNSLLFFLFFWIISFSCGIVDDDVQNHRKNCSLFSRRIFCVLFGCETSSIFNSHFGLAKWNNNKLDVKKKSLFLFLSLFLIGFKRKCQSMMNLHILLVTTRSTYVRNILSIEWHYIGISNEFIWIRCVKNGQRFGMVIELQFKMRSYILTVWKWPFLEHKMLQSIRKFITNRSTFTCFLLNIFTTNH